MKLFPSIPRHQKWMMGATFVVVAIYSISHNKEQLAEAARTHLTSSTPTVIDGDTVEFPNGRVRIVGIDAPDDDRPQLKAIATDALQRLAARDGGLDCSVSMFDYALRRENQCRTDPKSYGRLNLACRFPANKASVGASMVAQGYAVDYRMYSDAEGCGAARGLVGCRLRRNAAARGRTGYGAGRMRGRDDQAIGGPALRPTLYAAPCRRVPEPRWVSALAGDDHKAGADRPGRAGAKCATWHTLPSVLR
jgi:endonuclease YncB( thermonuclease family)